MRYLAALLALLVVASCATGPDAEEADRSGEDVEFVLAEGDELRADVPPAASPVPDEDVAALVSGNTAFALDLHRALVERGENLFVSPYSISVAFAMLQAGADGETAAQIAEAFDFNLDGDRLHAAIGALDRALASRGEGAEGADGEPFRLRVANALWGQEGFEIALPFLETLGAHYGAGLRVVDFVGATEAAIERINAWVDEQTEGRIPELLGENSVDALTRLVLTNAIYFNAAWADQFEEGATRPEPFTLEDGTQVEAPLMRKTAHRAHHRDGDIDVVALPYDGREVAMLLVVPPPGGLAELEADLTADRLSGWLDAVEPREVDLTMPRWEHRVRSSLPAVLRHLGVVDAFDPGKADLSGIDGGAHDDLHVQDAVHEAFVKVDEQGTEAAAATAISVGITSAPGQDETVTVRADRPFLYAIYDLETGAVLFLGRVADPRG